MNIAVTTAIAQGSIQGRALDLLGSGVPQEAVASALGVTAAYISQLLSDEAFASEVSQRKYEVLSAHTERDAAYDAIEDTLLDRLKSSLPLMFKPADILGAIKVVNGAKRRGTDSRDPIITKQNIVEITMPMQIIQEFTTNIANQVVKTGDTDLITIQSGDLLKQVDGDPELAAQTPNTPATITPDTLVSEPNLLENDTILDSL